VKLETHISPSKAVPPIPGPVKIERPATAPFHLIFYDGQDERSRRRFRRRCHTGEKRTQVAKLSSQREGRREEAKKVPDEIYDTADTSESSAQFSQTSAKAKPSLTFSGQSTKTQASETLILPMQYDPAVLGAP
jgi:hypothetical protein